MKKMETMEYDMTADPEMADKVEEMMAMMEGSDDSEDDRDEDEGSDGYESGRDDDDDDDCGCGSQETLSDDAVVAYCLEQINQTVNDLSHETQQSEDVDLPFKYFYAELPGLSKEVARDPQATRYVSTDVQDSVLATIAELMPVFTTDELAMYTADGERDEDQAADESAIVNHLFFNEYDGYTIIQNALMDALLNRNATCKVYWDEREVVEYEDFEEVTPIQLLELMQDPDREILMQEEVEEGSGVFNLKTKLYKLVERPMIEPIPPEQVVVSKEHQKPTLEDVRFCAHAMFVTRSSLIEQGFDEEIVNSLEISNINQLNYARSPSNYDTFQNDDELNPYTKVYECYATLDYDQDGIAERRKVIISGQRLLSNEPVSSVSMVGGTCTTIAHQYKGFSLLDRLKSIQDAKTPLMRAVIDGSRLAALGRTAIIEGKVNIDDMIKSRTGGLVRTKEPGAIEPIISNEVPPTVFQTLDWLDQVRSERGGSSITAANQTQNLQNTAASSFERAMSAMELVTAQNARNLAETLLRSLFVEMHNVLRENHKGLLEAKIKGQWLKTMPSEWTKRTGVKVTIGVSNTERARQIDTIDKVIEFQSLLQQQGSVMFDESKAYKAVAKRISLSGLRSPELYFTDPSSQEGQQASQSKQQQAQEQQQKDDQMQQAVAKAQMDLAQAEIFKGQAALQSQQVKFENDKLKAQLDQMKMALDNQRKEGELAFKYEKHEDDTAIALTELEVKASSDLSKQNEENKL